MLDLLGAELGLREIGTRLGIAGKTVSNVVSNILVKLQVGDRSQAAVVGRQAGLGRP